MVSRQKVTKEKWPDPRTQVDGQVGQVSPALNWRRVGNVDGLPDQGGQEGDQGPAYRLELAASHVCFNPAPHSLRLTSQHSRNPNLGPQIIYPPPSHNTSVVHPDPDPDGSEIICKLGSRPGSVINSGSDSGSGFESGSKLSSASN